MSQRRNPAPKPLLKRHNERKPFGGIARPSCPEQTGSACDPRAARFLMGSVKDQVIRFAAVFWMPAFAGMTAANALMFVMPAKSGIRGRF